MKGLLFTPEMARAVMRPQNPKHVTRRVISPQPMVTARTVEHFRTNEWHAKMPSDEIAGLTLHLGEHRCDYVPGERRCLLTTWAVPKEYDGTLPTDLYMHAGFVHGDGCQIWHAGMGDKPDWCGKSRPGRFLPNALRPLMPVFEIVSVRAERLQDITEEDAKAEGIVPWYSPPHVGPIAWMLDGKSKTKPFYDGRTGWHPSATACDAFRKLWNYINADRGFGWERNPWVWRIEFRPVT